MRFYEKFSLFLIAAIAFIIPIEHKYDKPLRHLAEFCIPKEPLLPEGFDTNIYFYPSDIAALLLLFSLLLGYKLSIRRLFLEKGLFFLWIMFFCAFFSILASPLSHYPTIYLRLLQLITPILITAFLLHTPTSTKRMHLFFSLLIGAAGIQSLIAICQYFSQDYLGLRLLSESRDEPAIFSIATGRRWIFDLFSNAPILPAIIRRSSGTFPHCNVLGGFLSFSILASYSYIANANKNLYRYGMGLLLIIQFFGLATTYSRSAIFGLAIGTGIWLAWAIGTKKKCLFLISAISIATLLSFGLLSEQYLARGGIVNYNQTSQESDQVRIFAQKTALNIIQDHPSTGVGFQQFSMAAHSYGNPTGAHNIYLFLCSEIGICGCLALLGFIGFTLITAIKNPFTPQMTSLFAALVAFLFIGGCDFYPILFQQGKLILFLITALLLSEALQIKHTQSMEKPCLN